MKVWKLKKGFDRRIRQHHPWVFSNELESSPKGHDSSDLVQLLDFKGEFLAWGYGSSQSLISFRAMSFDKNNQDPLSAENLSQKLYSSFKQRKKLGFKGSFRLCFGEVDFIPGLIVDYYLCQTDKGIKHVFAYQILTAGLNAFFDKEKQKIVFHKLVNNLNSDSIFGEFNWKDVVLILREDVQIRSLEGLPVSGVTIIQNETDIQLKNIDIVLNQASGDKVIEMKCNLYDGQKTGFFLDQTFNIFLFSQTFKRFLVLNKDLKKIKILDLCCYVGHWSAQLSALAKELDREIEVTQVDISNEALQFAKLNSERQGAVVVSKKLDVSKDLDQLLSQSYDVVIADPPAFIKSKKDIPIGQHAYLKMNTHAFRLAKSTGFVVSCSCSGLLTEEDFKSSLQKAIFRNFKFDHQVKGVLRGGHSADHPTLIQFPEGFYLKMYTHLVDSN